MSSNFIFFGVGPGRQIIRAHLVASGNIATIGDFEGRGLGDVKL